MEQKPNENYEERNATLDDDTPSISEDELQEELLDESGMNGFQKFIARMDEQKWVTAQWITGGILGLIAAAALFWDSISGAATVAAGGSTSIFTAPLIVAVVVAMIVPNIIEKQGMRRAPKLRLGMAATLLVAILVYVFYVLVIKKGL